MAEKNLLNYTLINWIACIESASFVEKYFQDLQAKDAEEKKQGEDQINEEQAAQSISIDSDNEAENESVEEVLVIRHIKVKKEPQAYIEPPIRVRPISLPVKRPYDQYMDTTPTGLGQREFGQASQSNAYPSVPFVEQEARALLCTLTTRPTSSYRMESEDNKTQHNQAWPLT